MFRRFRKFISAFIAVVLVLLISTVALAAYEFKFPTIITDTSGVTRAYYPVLLGYGGQALVNAGKIDANGLDTNMQIGSSSEKYMMSTTQVAAVIPNLPAGGKSTVDLYTGYTGPPATTGFPVIVGDHGYVTTADAAALELTNNFTVDQKGYVDTSLSQVIVFVGAGATAYAANGNVTPALPTGWLSGDLFICIVSSLDNVNSTLPAGWLAIDAGTNNGAGFRFTAYYKYAASGDVAPLVTHAAGSGISAVVVAYRGVGVGYPLNVLGATSVNTPASTTLTFHATGITTTMNGCRVVELGGVAGQNVDTANYTGAPTPTERVDAPNVAARPGVVVADFLQATAGATGSRVATITSFLSNGILLALTPSGADLVRKDEAYRTYISAASSVTSNIGGTGQPIVGGYNGNLNPAATEYNCLMGGMLWNATENIVYQCIPTGGTISGLLVRLSGNVAAASTYTFTLMVNSVPSALAVTISTGASTGSDWTNSVSVTAGQTVSLRSTFTGAPGALLASWSTIWNPTITGESICLIHMQTAVAAIWFGEIQGSPINGATTETWVQAPIPTAGGFKKLYVQLSADPGDPLGPDGYIFTLRLAAAGTTLTTTISADNTAGNNTTNTVAVVAGDLVDIYVAPLNAPAVAPECAIGMVFVPTVSGESLVMGGGFNATAAGITRYMNLCGTGRASWDATEASMFSLTQSAILKKLYVKLETAPGGADTYTISIREQLGNTGLTVTITGAATTGSDIDPAHAYISFNDDVTDTRYVSSATAVASRIHWGVVYSNPLASATVPGITSGIRRVVTVYNGANLTLTVYNDAGDVLGTISPGATASVPNNGANYVFALNNTMPYMTYTKITTIIAPPGEKLEYQPVAMLAATTVSNEDNPGTYDGTITWGSNVGISIHYGEMTSSASTSASATAGVGYQMPAATLPATWFAGGENVTNLPFYDNVYSIVSQMDFPNVQEGVQTAYFIVMVGLAFAAFLAIVMFTRSALLAALAFVIVLFVGSSMTIVPQWIPVSVLIVELGIMFLYRQVAY